VHLYERNVAGVGQFFLAIWVKSTPALIEAEDDGRWVRGAQPREEVAADKA
jgi:hypothetical protein